jgi:hypothetical protein
MSNGDNPSRTDAHGFAGWKYNILGSNMSQKLKVMRDMKRKRDEGKER